MDDLKAQTLPLFDIYTDLPRPQRLRALALLYDQDAALYKALVELLAADAIIGHLLDRPPAELLAHYTTWSRKNNTVMTTCMRPACADKARPVRERTGCE